MLDLRDVDLLLVFQFMRWLPVYLLRTLWNNRQQSFSDLIDFFYFSKFIPNRHVLGFDSFFLESVSESHSLFNS